MILCETVIVGKAIVYLVYKAITIPISIVLGIMQFVTWRNSRKALKQNKKQLQKISDLETMIEKDQIEQKQLREHLAAELNKSQSLSLPANQATDTSETLALHERGKDVDISHLHSMAAQKYAGQRKR